MGIREYIPRIEKAKKRKGLSGVSNPIRMVKKGRGKREMGL